MTRILLLLLLAACTRVVEKPVMLPVDTPPPPKGVAVRCAAPDWEPIRLPTTAAEQVAGRQRDRDLAETAIETCDGRRAKAVRHLRRTGATR